MPEHLHLLLSEPKTNSLSSTLRVIKGESSKLLKGKRSHFWQPRYYDFNDYTTRKFEEKIQYIHRNPVTRGLVSKPEDYRWSSFSHYATGEPSSIEIESGWTADRRERSSPEQNWVPHLRDSLIVAKVGIRATREPSSPAHQRFRKRLST